MTNSQITPPRRILAVGAHPDDVEAGCGGTIAKLVQAGSEAYVIVATNGNKGGEPARREQEAHEAARVLGVREVIFLGHNDGELFYSDALRAEVTFWIRKLQPDMVFTHESLPYSRFDGEGINHADHRAIGQATMDAVYPFARGASMYPEHIAQGLAPHTVRDLFIWGTLNPNHYEDVGSTVETKLAALAAHQSQFGSGMSDWFRECMRIAGRESELEYAESFMHIPFRM